MMRASGSTSQKRPIELAVADRAVTYYNKMTEIPKTTAKSTNDPRERPRSTLIAFVHYQGDKEVCTLFPPTAIVPQRTEAWISANGDSCVPVGKWR